MPAPRPYSNLLRAVCEGLRDVFVLERYADRVVADVLKSEPRWGSRDRAFVAETIYDCVRWWRLLTHLAGDARPEAVLAAYWWHRHGEPLNMDGYPKLASGELKARQASAKTQRALVESIPDWIDQLGMEELRGAWPEMLKSLNQPADVFLRVNTLKATRGKVIADLNAAGFAVEADRRGPEAILVRERRNLWGTPGFRDGHYEVQDNASQQVAHALQVAPGMTVIDACAGAGGKTLHLAALMQNRGRLLALDTDERKLAELKRRAKRAGVQNLEIRHIDSAKVIKRLSGQADRVLLDVPCTGLGVLRRNPDAKWKLQPGFLSEVRTWQADILERYPTMLREGGQLVYATCSVLPSESEEQVASYMARHPGLSLDLEQRLNPAEGYDGFYFGRLSGFKPAVQGSKAKASLAEPEAKDEPKL